MLARIRENFGQGRLGRHLGFQMSQMMIETGCRLLTIILVAQLFGASLFGVLNLFLTSLTFFQKVADGLGSSVVKSVAQLAGVDRSKAFGVGWWGICAATAVVAGMGLVGVGVFAVVRPDYAADHALLLALTYVYGVLQFARQFVESALRGLRRFSATFIPVAGMAPVQAVVSLALIYAGMRVTGYMALLAFFAAIQVVALVGVYRRESRRDNAAPAPASEIRQPLRELVLYSRPLVLRGLVSFFYMKVNIYVVDLYTSKADAGQYAFAERFLLIPLLVIGAFLATLAPRIAEKVSTGDREGLGYLMGRANGAILLAIAPFVVLFLLAEYPIRWFTPAYVPAADLIRVFAATLPITALATLCSGGLLDFGGRASVTTVIATAGAVLNVVTAFLFIRWWGTFGSALSILTVTWISGLSQILLAYYFFKLPFRIRFR